MNSLPTGTVTFLFTDIESSTKLWEKYPEEMKSALAKHDSILKEAIESNHGHIIKTTGDGVHAVFATAIDSVNATIQAQRELHSSFTIHNSSLPLKVRMGMHTGEAELRDGDYYGSTLNRAARIMSIGHGGQILLSETTLQIAREHFPQETSQLDLGEHNLKGLKHAEHVYQLSVPDLKQEFPPLNSLTHATDNLPTQLTSFIGRERELAETKEKLAGARLLTLIGPGGTGKTRLSIQLGTQSLATFKDGVWLVEFAPISDPSLVMQTIASALDVRETPGVPLKVLVHDYLREKHLLLILDNCEHLVEASAKIADEFLHIAPNIKIIASSREALGINGETVYRVPSLSLPNQDQATKESVLECESAQLFVERASASNPKFQLTDENASAVAQICSRLDGIPLAIELSASRITVFSPEQIAKRLDDRFKLLTGGSRTALPRQQTLRALIDWSYDLLSEDERALLRRLSVFAGGWTFEAAETICNNVDVFEHLPQLINKSLVTVNDEGDESRYFLLQTIRQYARDKLLDNGEGEGTRNRHLAYFLEMVEIVQPFAALKGRETEWISRLQTEFDNIRTAVEWGLSNDPFATARIMYALTYLMVMTNYAGETHRWGELTLKVIDNLGKDLSEEEQLHRARLLVSMMIMSFVMGDNEASRKEGWEAYPVLKNSSDDKRTFALSLGFLCGASVMTGHKEEAIEVFEEARALAEELGDKYIIGTVLSAGSRVEIFAKGDFAKAIEYHTKASELLKEHGNNWSYGITMFGFGNLYLAHKEFEKSREKYKIAMQAMQKLGSNRNVVMIKSDLAHILRYEGKHAEALAAYRETIKDWQRMGHRAAIAHQLECMAFIAKALEHSERAVRLFGAAEVLRHNIGIDMTAQERKEYEEEIADLKANMGEKEFASHWAEGRSLTMEKAIKLALEITI
ncbi:MAG TPA: adenylate/guanylate cyclase domain-containing protein [Anaerolineales bacterium]|nr:adenylate/guanylate cyclase domain-containing protein [Anaerolineales bacterium]